MRWSSSLALGAVVLAAQLGSAGAQPRGITASFVQMNEHGVSVTGYLAKPANGSLLPGVLVVEGDGGLREPVQSATRTLAARGFVALAVDYDPEHILRQSELVRTVAEKQFLTRLSIALDWLAKQPFADSQRLGALAWDEGVAPELELAGQRTLRATVVVDARGSVRQASLRGALFLKAEPGAFPGDAGAGQKPETVALWKRIHEYLGTNLKGTPAVPASPSTEPPGAIASIQDIMRVINSDSGVKGHLAIQLASPPGNEDQWALMRSEAAILAESGNWLLLRQPPKGSLTGWQMRAEDFRAAAVVLLQAVERRDFQAAQEALQRLPKSCAACHADYR
jgi:hypothetical protein